MRDRHLVEDCDSLQVIRVHDEERQPGRLPPYNVPMRFEWDPLKSEKNVRKHGVSFELAASIFFDPLAWTFPDPDHSYGEMRFLTIGVGFDGTHLLVAHIELTEESIRIISARRATTRERRAYEEA